MTSTLLPIFPAVDDVLFDFAQSDGFWANLETAFGTNYDVIKATELPQQWQSRNFSQLPSIEVLSDEVLGTANGAYSNSTNKIYLSASFLNTASSAAIINVILEEIGHYVDAQINQVDRAGDEGAIFAELVQGGALSDSQLALLRAENDWATMIIDGQLTAVEQSNPTPALVASYQGLRNARDVRVVGNYAYLADSSSTTADLKIVNISTPAAPVLVSQSNATNVISDVDFSNGYVYAADGTSGLRVIDVSNPSSPNLKSTYNSPGDAQDVKIVGNYAYVADGTSGLQIVNISNPNSPVIQGNAPAPDDVTGVKGNVSGVDIVGNYAYIISYPRQSGFGELQIFNISNPNSPVKLGESTFSISTQDILYSVQVAGNYAYVATGSRGLKIIDISNPISPTLKGEYFGSRSASAEDVQVVGNYAYVAYGVAGLDIIDISNPSSPILAASYAPVTEAYGPFGIVQKVTNYVTSVEVVNNYAYLTVQAAKDLGGLWILDVSQFTGTNQPPSVGLVVSPASVTEDGTQNLIYTFTRSGSTTNALTVNYTIGGTATLNTDYTRTGTNNTVTFAANSSTATVTIDPTPDTIVEPDETVILTLAAGTGYTVGTTTAVTGTITNDDISVTPIEAFGNTKLVKDATNKLYAQIGDNNPTAIKNGGTQITTNIYSGWQTLAAETVNGVNQVLWKYNDGNYLHLWSLDNNWNWQSSTGWWGLNSPEAFTQETNFQQDFNGDNQIGNPYTPIEAFGNTKLVKDATNKLYAQIGNNNPIAIKNGGTQITTNIYSGWQTLAAETVNGVNQVLWKYNDGNYLHLWSLDNNWNWQSSTGWWGLNSPEAFTQETNFQQDFNGDGVIGQPFTPIEAFGNTKLVKDATNKLYAQIGDNNPTAIKNGGTQITTNIYSGWQTLAAETVNGVNQVLWKYNDGNYLHLWTLDNNWNWQSSTGWWGLNSSEAFTQETNFQQDFNGDNQIGNPSLGILAVSANVPEPIIGSSNDDILTGTADNDILIGGLGNDTLNGAAGLDTLTGGVGTDIFIFQFSQSTAAALDRVTDFAIGTDKIDLLSQAGAAINAPVAFTRAADSTTTNIDTIVTNVFTDANGATAGNQALGINSAVLVRVANATTTYLIINDGTAGFQSANDLVINLTGLTGSLLALGTIAVNSFFV